MKKENNIKKIVIILLIIGVIFYLVYSQRTVEKMAKASLNIKDYDINGNLIFEKDISIESTVALQTQAIMDPTVIINPNVVLPELLDTADKRVLTLTILNDGNIPILVNFNNSKFSEESLLTGRKGLNLPCYQESANVAESCGAITNMIQPYAYASEPANPSNAFDGNWGTYVVLSTTEYSNNLRINYTVPNNADLKKTIYAIKTSGGVINFTVPQYCYANSDKNLKFILMGNVNSLDIYCYRGDMNNEPNLIYNDYPSGTGTIYEEAVWWNII